MAGRTAYPPMRRHSIKQISPANAQAFLTGFLEKTPSNPHLHPDAMLAQNGVHYPQTGPQGGLTLHHLRRIEAGLRGEHLVAQSREELSALFASELPASDDSKFPSERPKKKSKRERSVERVQGWNAVEQDQYAQEQGVVDEEIGSSLARQGQQTSEPTVRNGIDKNARKAAKKAAKKARRREETQKKAEAD